MCFDEIVQGILLSQIRNLTKFLEVSNQATCYYIDDMHTEPCDILHSSSSRELHLALEKQQSDSNRLYTATHAVTPTSTCVFSVR